LNIKKGIAYVLLANLINLSVNLFSGFVLPKYLSIETYANIRLFQLYTSYIGITHLGFADGMYLRNGGKKLKEINKYEIKTEFKTFCIFQFFITIIAIILSLVVRNEMLLFCSMVIIPINISNYLRNLYNAIGEFKNSSKYTNINTIFIFVINIFLLLIIKSDYYYSYIIGQIIVYFLYCIYILIETRKIFGNTKHCKFNKNYFIEDIKSGFLLLIGNFSNIFFTTIDRIFVRNSIGLTQFAFYSFATSIEGLLNVFITPISTVMYNYFCNTNDINLILNVKRKILIFSSLLIALIFPAKFIIEHWITKYNDAINVLFFLVSSQYISIMIRTVHINLYKAQKKQNRYFKIMILIVILSILLNTLGLLVSKSIVVISIATLITNIIWYIIGEIEHKKYKLEIKDYVYTFTLMIAFLICGNLLNSEIGFFIYLVILSTSILLFEKKQFFELLRIVFTLVKTKYLLYKNN